MVMLNDICITIDIDPDGLSGQFIDRNTLTFDAFNAIKNPIFDLLEQNTKENIPITWFVRIDEQIKINKGSYLYLFENNQKFWQNCNKQNHEIAWHPHLYKIINGIASDILKDNQEIEDNILNIWNEITSNQIKIETFRNGEGWMTTHLFNLLETLNIKTDSTAIAKRVVNDITSKDWTNIPNHHYYPDFYNCKHIGVKRNTIELPMNSWKFQTSYDTTTKLRYINPAIHTNYFLKGLEYINDNWNEYKNTDTWVFITHPDEIAPNKENNLLYANSIKIYAENILLFQKFIEQKNIPVKYTTIDEATKKYRGN
jgi:hypothetical protein